MSKSVEFIASIGSKTLVDDKLPLPAWIATGLGIAEELLGQEPEVDFDGDVEGNDLVLTITADDFSEKVGTVPMPAEAVNTVKLIEALTKQPAKIDVIAQLVDDPAPSAPAQATEPPVQSGETPEAPSESEPPVATI